MPERKEMKILLKSIEDEHQQLFVRQRSSGARLHGRACPHVNEVLKLIISKISPFYPRTYESSDKLNKLKIKRGSLYGYLEECLSLSKPFLPAENYQTDRHHHHQLQESTKNVSFLP